MILIKNIFFCFHCNLFRVFCVFIPKRLIMIGYYNLYSIPSAQSPKRIAVGSGSGGSDDSGWAKSPECPSSETIRGRTVNDDERRPDPLAPACHRWFALFRSCYWFAARVSLGSPDRSGSPSNPEDRGPLFVRRRNRIVDVQIMQL